MQFAIICSKNDQAGLNIRNTLINAFKITQEHYDYNPVYELGNARLYTSNHDSVYCENIDRQLKADFFIFATKHESRSGIKSLSVHTQGNWHKADFGGKDHQLCIAPANYLKAALTKLNELAQGLDFDIIQECTHHGPYVGKPSMFIEIGSDETQWKRKDAAEIIAKTIMHLISNPPKQYKTAVGIGGLHHCPNFKKIILNTDIAIGHVCPKYMLEHLTPEMVSQAIDRTWPSKAQMIILDWKGLGKYKEHVNKVLENIDIEIKKTKDF